MRNCATCSPTSVDDASRASAIIARLRELVQRVAPSREPLQLNDLVREVLALAQPELTEQRVTVRLEIRGDLPRVLGDQVQLQQVIFNLVMNAAEAMSAVPDERRILTIGGRLWQRNGQLAALITVHDLGCGFGTEDSERLFEAFYTTKPKGLGMGLRISHSIVEAHGGHLWAEANPDAGATFFVALPGCHTGRLMEERTACGRRRELRNRMDPLANNLPLAAADRYTQFRYNRAGQEGILAHG